MFNSLSAILITSTTREHTDMRSGSSLGGAGVVSPGPRDGCGCPPGVGVGVTLPPVYTAGGMEGTRYPVC